MARGFERRTFLKGLAGAALVGPAIVAQALAQKQDEVDYDIPQFTLEHTNYLPTLTPKEKEAARAWLTILNQNSLYQKSVHEVQTAIIDKLPVSVKDFSFRAGSLEFDDLKKSIPKLNSIRVEIRKSFQKSKEVCRVEITFELLEPDKEKRESPDDPQLYEFLHYNIHGGAV